MFCSECGKPVSGKFCTYCGTPVQAPEGPVPMTGVAGLSTPPTATFSEAPPAVPSQDWSHEVNYAALVHHPQVQDILARQIPPAKLMSGEDFMSNAQTLAGKFIPGGDKMLPQVPLMNLAHDVYTRMGIKSGKTRTEHFSQPVGRILVAALCSAKRNGFGLRDVQQASDGCLMNCSLASDMFSLEGDLFISIKREENGTTTVDAFTRIAGQMFDWGKSNRALNQLFSDLHTLTPT